MMVRRLASPAFVQLTARLLGQGWLEKYFEQKYLEYAGFGSRRIYLKYDTGRLTYRESPTAILNYYNDGKTRPSTETITAAKEFFIDLVKNIPDGLEHEDQKVKKIAAWVNKKATYRYDSVRWGKKEYWSSPFDLWREYQETGAFVDDCDGWAAMLYWACRLIGIPKDRIWIRAGMAAVGDQKEGHANVIYIHPLIGMSYVEGSFYPAQNQREWMQWPPGSNRYPDTWFIFNESIVRQGFE